MRALAVAILAILHSNKKGFKPSTVIIEQYRPPIEKYVIELPAGMCILGTRLTQVSPDRYSGRPR